MAHVNIEIAGRTYRMACDDGEEERLQQLGVAFDRMISGLRESFGEIGDRRLVVMAGLLAIDDATSLRTRLAAIEREVGDLRRRLAETEAELSHDPGFAPQLLAMAERIDRLAHALNDTVREDAARVGAVG